jgi:DNA processing protein
MNEYKQGLLKLSTVHDLGAIRLKNLLEYFGSTQDIIKAGEDGLKRVPGIGQKLACQISSLKNSFNMEKELEKLDRHGVSVIAVSDSDYPENLKYIYAPPFILFVKGKIIAEDALSVSVVGTRKPTSYGRMAAEKLSEDIARRGITIVSGLARGIDTVAHKSVLASKGRTIAVLGSGIDVCYPPENKRLLEQIAEQGAVVSEFPLSTVPDKRNFPLRNRIISGLSLGTVVIEAPEKSGALITAEMALEQGREVFAVPGNIFSENSRGTHYLLKQGAKLVESYEDIIEEITAFERTKTLRKSKSASVENTGEKLSVEEEKIYALISCEPVQFDTIAEDVSMTAQDISVVLMGLELKGKIKEIPGKRYIRKV